MAKTLPKLLLASYLILTLMGTLSGSLLGIPMTATLNPAVKLFPHFNVTKSTTSVSLQDFIRSVSNGDARSVVGVYLPSIMALPVSQQPHGNAGYVTRDPNQSTQFGLANQYGTVGILAHNDLAGAQFSAIGMNQYAIVVFGDGHVEYFVVEEVQNYQALSPTSTFSDFINLDNSSERLSASDLFNRIYAPGNRLVFQTCIDAHGDPSWGRMFIIASPANRQVRSVVEQTSHLLEFASFGMAAY